MKIDRKLLTPTLLLLFYNLIFFLKEPYVAVLASEITPNESILSLLFSVMPLVIIFASPILGNATDHVGRKKVLLFGVLCQVFALFFYIISEALWHLSLAKAFEGISFIAVGIALFAKIQDKVADTHRGLLTGVVFSLTQLGHILGPLLGSFLTTYFSLKILFYVAFDLSLLLLVCILLFYASHNTQHISARDFNILQPIKKLWTDKQLIGVAIVGFMGNTTAPALQLFLPLFLLQELGVTHGQVGVVFGVLGVFHLLQFLAGFCSDRFGRLSTIFLGLFIQAIAFAGIATTQSYSLVLFTALLFSLGFSLTASGTHTLMSDIGEMSKNMGTVTGGIVSLSKIGNAVGFLLGSGLIAILGIRYLYVFYATTFLLTILLSWPFLRSTKQVS